MTRLLILLWNCKSTVNDTKLILNSLPLVSINLENQSDWQGQTIWNINSLHYVIAPSARRFEEWLRYADGPREHHWRACMLCILRLLSLPFYGWIQVVHSSARKRWMAGLLLASIESIWVMCATHSYYPYYCLLWHDLNSWCRLVTHACTDILSLINSLNKITVISIS